METQTSLFRNRNFLLVFLGALVSNMGATLYSFAVSFYILKITNNNAVIQGAYLAVVGIVLLIFTIIGGVLADRYNKGKIMYLCDYVKGLILLLSTMVMLFVKNTTVELVLLFAVGVTGNIVSGIFSPASSALIPIIVEESQLQKANSYFSLLSSVQGILGVILAGVLYAAIPVNVLFFIVAGCYILSGLSEMFIKYSHEARNDKLTIKTSLKEIGSGFKYLYLNKALFVLIISVSFLNFFFSPITSNYLPFLVANDIANSEYLFKNFLAPEMWSSIVNVILCVGMIAGAIIVSVFKYKKASNMVKIWLSIVSFLMLGLALSNLFLNDLYKNINPHILIVCVISLGIGISLPFINIPASTSIQKITDKKMLGKVDSVISVGSQALTPLSSLLAGILISTAGSSTLLFVCFGGALVCVIILLKSKSFSNL